MDKDILNLMRTWDDGFVEGYKDGQNSVCVNHEPYDSPFAQGYAIGHSEGNLSRHKKTIVYCGDGYPAVIRKNQ